MTERRFLVHKVLASDSEKGHSMKNGIQFVLLGGLCLGLVFPLTRWGSLIVRPPQTLTVSGSAEREEKNQIAQFYAGVTATNSEKQKAIDEVNTQMQMVIEKLKAFGIADADIQTQSLSVYQDQEQITEGGRQRYTAGGWRANNSIQIKLRDGARVSELMALLGESGLTDISGPSFMLDASDDARADLLQKAVEKAREKAEFIAKANKKKVYSIISITEGYAAGPQFDMAMKSSGMGGGAVEPGTSLVSATATVVFELK